MWFEEIGGYVLHPVGPTHHASFWAGYPVLNELLSVRSGVVFEGALTPSLRSQALSELRQSNARTVIVGDVKFHGKLAKYYRQHYGQLVRTVEQLLGRSPDRLEGGVALWYMQSADAS
jgi:hypothetical protein